MSNEDIHAIVKKIQSARMDLAHKQPFYASLLFHMQFSLDEITYSHGFSSCYMEVTPRIIL